MNQDCCAIYQLLAQGRLNPAQAERLMEALLAERETVWAVAGGAAMVVLSQIKSLAPELAHIMCEALAGVAPVLHHIARATALCAGGLL